MDSSAELEIMHIRLRHAEDQLSLAQDEISMLRSENQATSWREDFLLGEVVKLSSDLREMMPEPYVEAECVKSRLDAITQSGPMTPAFWSNREKGYILALLQDRVARAVTCLKSCSHCMTEVHHNLFLELPVPVDLKGLIERFCEVAMVRGATHEQLVEGAVLALVFVRLRYPPLNLDFLHLTTSSVPDDAQLGPIYDAMEHTARQLVTLMALE
ncbi:uncharacterized protein LOC106865465 [Brachypodium distachyon]|uniref:Uncharacterized protein n=1 Tax=Brachypodium distachyon TaxID=15368 RepID=A0A2K2DJR1_BRADI|nr:uncharacterized protein LOC106865465 [Brachypodium distachyon]PNT74519.1 hypothetical protein BRADI_1g16208v3 [Brachypodium distachyon]|eukprot:XP_014750949.1 uncharacterized protein LOC106865465 [Brachypodium distachyon]